MRSRRPIRLLAVALALAALAAAAAFVHHDGASPGTSPAPQATSPCPATPASAGAEPAAPSTTVAAPAAGAPGAAATPTARPPIAAELKSLKLVSYYPANAAWTNMWTDWQPDRIAHDLCGIRALGANAVRIIVQPRVFGYPTPTATMMDRLATAVDLAAARGLRVQLTLFDWWSDYTDFSGSATWAQAVLSPFRDDSRIVFCELQNEINPYDSTAMAWVRHVLPTVRAALRSVPVTLSVSGNSPAESLIQLGSALAGARLDFYDMHYYADAGAAFSLFSQAESAVAPAPLYVGETGASSAAAASPGGDADQDLYLRTVEWAAQRAGLSYAAPWMYTDLVPSAVPTLPDPVEPNQRYFGLVRTDGTAKPAARSIQDLFAGRPISTAFGNTFDFGHNDLPEDWQATDPSGGSLSWDAAVGHTALGSARISGTAASADPIPAFYATPVVQPLREGETVRFSAWAKGVNATGTNRVAVSWYDDSGNFVHENDSPALPHGSPGWTELTVTAQMPAGATNAEVRLQSDGDSGTVWFDDASFAPLD